MITNFKNTQGRSHVRWFIITLACGVLMAFDASAQSQTQRKPKGPPPPSYDEVLQRALAQKKSASNAPTASAITARVAPPAATGASPASEIKRANEPPSSPPVVPATAAITTNNAPPNATSPAPPAKSAVVVTQTVPSAAAQTTPNSTPVLLPEPAKPAKAGSKKGPVFSPLPADLAPTNELQKAKPLAANSVTPDANNSMETLDDKHLLAIGDRVSFRIVEDEDEPKSLVIADSGELELAGSLGRFAATGKTCQKLARIIKTELDKNYYYNATVIIALDLMARSRGKIYIVGPVRVPGPHEIPSDEVLTLSKAILRAGDFTDFADKKQVKVTRKSNTGGDETFIVNVAEILEKGRKELDLPLQPDDLIYVKERLIRF